MNKNYPKIDYESQIPHLIEEGVTEFTIHDTKISKDKKRILGLIKLLATHAPEVFTSILIDASVIDREVAAAASEIYCSFDIPLNCIEKGGKLLFDKKYYGKKASLLNDYALVFGFELNYGVGSDDSLKSFLDRLDFAVQQYPNHLIFPQMEGGLGEDKTPTDGATSQGGADSQVGVSAPAVTGTFSAKDIRYARDVAFAAKTFYSTGRAVPWFLSVLKPLRIYPSRFFADFGEWQRCNNCDFRSGFDPEKVSHKEIEKMQLLFIGEKYEEKHKRDLITLVNDIVSINGAMSRLVGEDEESTIETSYNPEELFGPESMDLEGFVENVCMEHCSVKIFAGEEGPDFLIL